MSDYKTDLSDGRRARWQRMTPEERSAAIKRQWATRKARATVPAVVMIRLRGLLRQIEETFNVEYPKK